MPVPLRPLVVTPEFPPSRASAAITVAAVVDEAVRRGDHPTVLHLTSSGPPRPRTWQGVKVLTAKGTDPRSVREAVVAAEPGLVHVADPAATGPAPVEVARALGLPVVLSQHSLGSGPFSERRLAASWDRLLALGAARALVPCLAVADPVRSARTSQGRTSPARTSLHVWRPGVDTDLFRPEARVPALGERWRRHRDGERLVVIHAGPVDGANVRRRLAEVGGLSGVRLVVARGGPDAERLRGKVPALTLLPDPSTRELAQALASADVLVQPRRKDLECHSARRALACGVPVVGLDATGLRDLVADGENGLLADPDDKDGLRDLVRRLQREPGLRDRLAGRARESVAGRTWADAYEELAEVHWAAALAP